MKTRIIEHIPEAHRLHCSICGFTGHDISTCSICVNGKISQLELAKYGKDRADKRIRSAWTRHGALHGAAEEAHNKFVEEVDEIRRQLNEDRKKRQTDGGGYGGPNGGGYNGRGGGGRDYRGGGRGDGRGDHGRGGGRGGGRFNGGRSPYNNNNSQYRNSNGSNGGGNSGQNQASTAGGTWSGGDATAHVITLPEGSTNTTKMREAVVADKLREIHETAQIGKRWLLNKQRSSMITGMDMSQEKHGLQRIG
jgi:hypothetical protein